MKHHPIHLIFLVSIFIVAIFVRLYDYSSLMHFELDQARDAYVVYDVLTYGIWPAHGPMASGSSLFLGPLFYHVQIVAGFFFHGLLQIPLIEANALPDLFFGVLSLVLVYKISRRLFSIYIAYALSLLAATSLFLVTYDRFGWNPNSMTFWSLLLFYLLLCLWESKGRHQLVLAAIGGLSVAVLIQLHFVAFVAVPLIVIAFLFIIRKKIVTRVLLLSCVSFFFFVTPYLFLEYRATGSFVQSFSETITKKQQGTDHHALEKVFRAGQETSTYFVTTFISDPHGRSLIKTRLGESDRFLCSGTCQENILHLIAHISLFAAAVGLLLFTRRMLSPDAWILTVIWLFFGGVVLYALAYQISPRFYLFMMPPFLVLWGVLLTFIHTWLKVFLSEKIANVVFSLIIALLGFYNIFGLAADFATAHQSQIMAIDAPRDVILARSDRVTLGALRNIAEHVAVSSDRDDYVIVGDNRYARALKYLLEVEKHDPHVKCYAKRGGFESGEYSEYTIWLLVRERTKKHIPDDLLNSHEIVDNFSAGTITIYKLSPLVKNQLTGGLPHGCHTR